MRSRQWATTLGLGLIVTCLLGEAAVLRVGIDDLDEGYFIQQAVRVVHGQIPYRDFQTLYTPGLLYVHAALFGLLGGPFVLAPRALALAARAALALLLFGIARPLVRQPLWAALPGVFLLVGLDDAPVLWEPHPGWLSTLFAVLAAWCLSHRPTVRWLAAAGMAAAVAYVYKQNTGAFILAAIVLQGIASQILRYPSPRPSPRAGRGSPINDLAGGDGSVSPRAGRGSPINDLAGGDGSVSPRAGRGSPSSLHSGMSADPPRPSRGEAARNERVRGESKARVLVPLASFAAVTALWLVPLLIALRGDVTQLGVIVGAVNQAGLLSAPEWPNLVPAACLLGGVWLWRRGQDEDARLRWYVVAGGALFLTQYPRMDALHLVWSAPLLLVVGAVTLDRLRPLLAGVLVLAAFAVTAPTVASRLATVQQPRVAISDVPYAIGLEIPDATRSDLQGVIADIQARTSPNEPIFVYPTSPLVYALAERPNPTRFDHLNPGAADAAQIQRVISDLESSGVRLVVVSDFWQAAWSPPGANATLESWLATHFTDVARYGAYRVLVPAL